MNSVLCIFSLLSHTILSQVGYSAPTQAAIRADLKLSLAEVNFLFFDDVCNSISFA